MSSNAARRYGKASTREALLEAGASLLLGPEAGELSMGAVAARAGVSRQATYLHFPSRAALLLGVVDYANDKRGLSRRTQRIASAADAYTALDAFMSTAVWQAAHLGAALRAVRRLLEDDAELAESFRERKGRRAAARDVVDRLADEGSLALHLTPRAAASLLMAVSAPESCEELLRDGWSVKRASRELSRVARTALCARS